MATTTGLVRSFYGWLARRERGLQEGSFVFSKQRPTSLSAITKVARHTAEVLKGTAHEKRANYWLSLFEGIEKDGWLGELRTEDHCRLQIRQDLNEAISGRNLAL